MPKLVTHVTMYRYRIEVVCSRDDWETMIEAEEKPEVTELWERMYKHNVFDIKYDDSAQEVFFCSHARDIDQLPDILKTIDKHIEQIVKVHSIEQCLIPYHKE